MRPAIRYVLCDVFTDARALETELMQALAREMGFSESTLILPPEAGGHARVRIFTPACEMPFAGHPTLGTAFVIGESTQLDEIRLETGIGVVPVRLEREGPRVVFGWMTQPVPTVSPFDHTAELLAALRVGRSELPVEVYDCGIAHVYVNLPSRDEVAAIRPDMARLATLGVTGSNVFAGDGERWKTRMFAPASGVPEDPATGSAAGPLALHLARHGRITFGTTICIEQGTEMKRPSELYARVRGDAGAPIIEVGGAAVVVGRGEFRLERG